MGGLLFGYDQGVISVTLTMDQFLTRFHQIAPGSGGASFNKGKGAALSAHFTWLIVYKGLLTAMIELGALFGALNTGWIADKYSRKYCIVMAVIVFIVGSALQTASINYDMLIVARLIGGVGIGS